MAGKLQVKIALVTGGSSGIGLATAKFSVQAGAFIYITGRRQAELNSSAASIGDQAAAIRADIAKTSDLDALYARVQREKGRSNVLFECRWRNHGTPWSSHRTGFDHTFKINVKGTVFTVQKALPLVPEDGAIILTGSTASIKGSPAFSVYAATKAAVRSIARG